jgi:beta-galactosidase
VKLLYEQIGQQLHGLLWKDGGPVIGIQLSNEYSGPPQYLMDLKQMAQQAGLDVPLYTRTGWPGRSTPPPFGQILPIYGAYGEGFWDRVLTPMPGRYWTAYLFSTQRTDAAVAAEMSGREPGRTLLQEAGEYPYLCCEMGAGMETSYHRRIYFDPDDALAVAMTRIGSGANMPGYYMYHGGTNPDGKLSTLQESQATGYPNDMPVKSYDFQAPLGEFGQIRPQYHLLLRLHLFLHDYGAQLARMPAVMPQRRPSGPDDTRTLRWAVRTDGQSGFIFVSNYQRLENLPAQAGVRFQVRLPGGALTLPDEPVTIPAGAIFLWPFNMDLAGAKLIYATAEPMCQLQEPGATDVIFAQTQGVASEFVFDASGVQVESTTGTASTAGGRIRVAGVQPGRGAAIRLRTDAGGQINIVLLNPADSLACWKGELAGQEHVFLTRSGLVLDGNTIQLRSSDPQDLTVAMLPAAHSISSGRSVVRAERDGLFTRYSAGELLPPPLHVNWTPVKAAGPARHVSIGPRGVAQAPSDADFAQAAVWQIHLPPDTSPDRRLLLRMHYVGDVARVTLDGKLLTDNFYNGKAFDLGLTRFAPQIYHGKLLLEVLPLSQDEPIYLAKSAWPAFGNASSVATVKDMKVFETQQLEFQVQ